MVSINNINQERKFQIIGAISLIGGMIGALCISYKYDGLLGLLGPLITFGTGGFLCYYTIHIAPDRARRGASFIPRIFHKERVMKITSAGNTLLMGKNRTVMFRVIDAKMTHESWINLLRNSVPEKSTKAVMHFTGMDDVQSALKQNVDERRAYYNNLDSKTKRVHLQFITNYYNHVLGRVPGRGVWIRFHGKVNIVNTIHYGDRSGIRSKFCNFEDFLGAMLRRDLE